MKYLRKSPFRWPVVSMLILFGGILYAQFPITLDRLDMLNLVNANEQVYIHTDCEVYAPGDTIWFKAYIRSKSSLQKSDLSEVFSVFLAGEGGNIIDEEKLVIVDAQARGYLKISKNIDAGMYQLLGYSSWMKNFDPEQVFRKEVLILNESDKGIRYVPLYDKSGYLPGDTIRVIVESYDAFNNLVEGSRFRYKFLVNGDIIERGAGITSMEEVYPLVFVTPDSISENQVLRIWDDKVTVNFDIPVNSDIDIAFFPEGGNCLLGEQNNIAYRAVYTSGQAVDISGEIIDDEGKILLKTVSEHNGMGRFLYLSDTGPAFLRITQPEGYNKLFKLPEGQKSAWTLQTKTSKEQIFVKVGTNADVFDTCLFVASIRGYSYFYKLIPSEAHSGFKVPTSDFPSGIAVLTLLNRSNVPLAERLVFVNQEHFIHAGLNSRKAKHLPRDLVSIDIDILNKETDLSKGQYSLTVYDASFGSSLLIDNPNIIGSNYLSPEIKGQIENPNYYFVNKSREVQYHLDLLLMTQGWRKYSYQHVLSETYSIKLPESQDVIKGNIKRFKFAGEPYPTPGEILVYFAGNSKRILTDLEGNFTFLPEYTVEHTSQIIVSAKDNKESDKVYLSLNDQDYRNWLEESLHKNFEEHKVRTTVPLSVFEDLKRKIDLNRNSSIWIDEVSIKREEPKEYEDLEIGMIKNFSTTRSPSANVLESSMDMNDLLSNMGYNGIIEDDTFRFFYQGEQVVPRFIIDGIDRHLTYSDILIEYPPEVIENIYVTLGLEPYMVYGAVAVIYIQTDIEKFRARMYENKIQNSKVIPGLQIVKEFYNPKYESFEDKKNPDPDLRKTVYWNPDLKVGEDGKTTVQFYNSDRYGKINLVLEGMTDTGLPVYGETTYSIATYRE